MDDYLQNKEEIQQLLKGLAGIQSRVCKTEEEFLGACSRWFTETASDRSAAPLMGFPSPSDSSPFAWEDSRKLVKTFLEKWEQFLGEAHQKLIGKEKMYGGSSYARWVLEEARRESRGQLNSGSLADLMEASSRAYGRLYGDYWNGWTHPHSPLLSMLRELLRDHAVVCRELRRRYASWVSDPQSLEEFRHYASTPVQPVPGLPWKTLFSEQHERLQEPPPPAVPPTDPKAKGKSKAKVVPDVPAPPSAPVEARIPAIARVPAKRECWDRLRKRYVECLRDAEAIRWENKLLDRVVLDAKLLEMSYNGRVNAACALGTEEAEALVARCPNEVAAADAAVGECADRIRRVHDACRASAEAIARLREQEGVA